MLGSLLTVFSPATQELLAEYLLTGVVREEGIDDSTVDGGGDDDVVLTSVAEQVARNRELIGRRVARIGWAETQELVAGIFRAMGYHTSVAPAGADGGVDVLAGSDPLFLHPPLVKVQVKARPETKITAGDIRQLLGIVRPEERAVFVSTGGFTTTATKEFAENRAVQLIGMERLLDLFLGHYDELDDETKRLVPLKQVWILADEDEVPESVPPPEPPIPAEPPDLDRG